MSSSPAGSPAKTIPAKFFTYRPSRFPSLVGGRVYFALGGQMRISDSSNMAAEVNIPQQHFPFGKFGRDCRKTVRRFEQAQNSNRSPYLPKRASTILAERRNLPKIGFEHAAGYRKIGPSSKYYEFASMLRDATHEMVGLRPNMTVRDAAKYLTVVSLDICLSDLSNIQDYDSAGHKRFLGRDSKKIGRQQYNAPVVACD